MVHFHHPKANLYPRVGPLQPPAPGPWQPCKLSHLILERSMGPTPRDRAHFKHGKPQAGGKVTPPAGLQVPRPCDVLPFGGPATFLQENGLCFVPRSGPSWSGDLVGWGGVGSAPCMHPDPQGSLRPTSGQSCHPTCVPHHLRHTGRPGRGPYLVCLTGVAVHCCLSG